MIKVIQQVALFRNFGFEMTMILPIVNVAFAEDYIQYQACKSTNIYQATPICYAL